MTLLATVSPWLHRLRGSPPAACAAFVLIALIGGAVFAPWLVRTDPYDLATLDLLDSHLPPAFLTGGDTRYLLGTDSQGADLLSLILYGLRASLIVGLLAVALSVALGTTAGLVSGYLGGLVDGILMRMADVQFTFPALLLALLIGGISQKLLTDAARVAMAMPILVLALGIAHWPHFARLVRGAVLVEREKDYVAAARLVGRGPAHIMAAQLLPNVLNPIIVLATLDIAFAIMSEATLSFLGFGMPSSRPSLGTLIRIGYGYFLSGEWWVVLFPGLALVLTLVSVNLLGDWLRDWLDPKLR
ncbi:MAG: ABC transporter permease [Proteobacteria bacterium]|nr:ABC transporter permease [Pseudomonadota bacterium]MBI3500035.1 ABC transporter permease [Pseudomonadota bacterium]